MSAAEGVADGSADPFEIIPLECPYLFSEDRLGNGVEAIAIDGRLVVEPCGLMIDRARSRAFGEDAYPNLHLKAAALLHSIVSHHALVGGNKRLGWLATTVFLDINGETIELGDDEAFELVLAVSKS